MNYFKSFSEDILNFNIENFEEKALAIYQYIQEESKVFSFGINTKISSLKSKLQ